MAMPHIRTALLAGVAAIAVAGTSGLAMAQSPQTSPQTGPQTHVMNVALPGGGTAQIRYTGDVPPQLAFSRGPAALADWSPMPTLFGPDSPFAMLDRISTEMDLQAAAMLHQAAALTARVPDGQAPNSPTIEAATRNLPPGSASYSSISRISGNTVCTQSVEVTATGNGTPKVVRHTSGDCGPDVGAASSVNRPAASAPNRRPDTLWIKDDQPTPYRGLIQKTSSPQ
jgi:hypothetical protein